MHGQNHIKFIYAVQHLQPWYKAIMVMLITNLFMNVDGYSCQVLVFFCPI